MFILVNPNRVNIIRPGLIECVILLNQLNLRQTDLNNQDVNDYTTQINKPGS